MDDMVELAQWIENKLEDIRTNMLTLSSEGKRSELAYWQSNGVSIGYLEVLVQLQRYGVDIVNGRAIRQ